jgi:hypothetical protein
MKESYIEDIVNHDDLESCVYCYKATEEVLTGAHAGGSVTKLVLLHLLRRVKELDKMHSKRGFLDADNFTISLLLYFRGFCSSPSVIMLFVYMKRRFSLRYRDLEEMMMIRGASIDHATLQRWAKRFVRLIDARVSQHRIEMTHPFDVS